MKSRGAQKLEEAPALGLVQRSAIAHQEASTRCQAKPETQIVVDLENQTISIANSDVSESFDIDPYKKTCMINGYDDIDYLLSKKEQIEAFEAEQTL